MDSVSSELCNPKPLFAAHAQVKQALWKGGIERSNKPQHVRNTPGLERWQDLVRPSYPTLAFWDMGPPFSLRLSCSFHCPAGCRPFKAIKRFRMELLDCPAGFSGPWLVPRFFSACGELPSWLARPFSHFALLCAAAKQPSWLFRSSAHPALPFASGELPSLLVRQ